MHHAEREIGKNHGDQILRQLEDITENGKEEAEKLAEKFKGNLQNIKYIYTSPYARCKHTAEIINKYLNVPIIEDERFNEMQRGEEWKDLLKRNIDALDDIVNKHGNDDNVICITSGVNLSAFICYFYNIKPSNDVPWSQAINITPINFRVESKKGTKDLD